MFAASTTAGEVSGNDLLNYAHTGCFNTFHQGQAICIPDEVQTRDQIPDGVIKYLNDHPGKRDLSASPNVVIALKDAFPCAFPNQ